MLILSDGPLFSTWVLKSVCFLVMLADTAVNFELIEFVFSLAYSFDDFGIDILVAGVV